MDAPPQILTVFRTLVTGTAFAICVLASQAEPFNPKEGFIKEVQPFMKQHCFDCHGGDEARGGFSLNDLHLDFLKGTNADLWHEVMDVLNLGDMPPSSQPRPDIKEQTAVVEWISASLRAAELQAADAGGRIPMRRLNREEYKNIIKDLFLLTDAEVEPLVEGLPADGKAEGFDRLSVALFIDKTQLNATIDVATKIAEKVIVDPENESPEEFLNSKITEPEEHYRRINRQNPEVLVEDRKDIPVHGYVVRADGVEFLTTPHHRNDQWNRIHSVRIDEIVQEPGFYRIRVHATKEQRGRKEPLRFQIVYAGDTPFREETIVPIDESGITEVKMHLRPGPEDIKRSIDIYFDHEPNLRKSNEEWSKWHTKYLRKGGDIQDKAAAGAPEAELEEMRRELEELAKKRDAIAEKVIFNPEKDIEAAPRVFLDKVEVEGPVYDEWPPAGHQRMFPDEDENILGPAYAEKVLRRFLPYAYRRFVTEEEVDAAASTAIRAMNEGVDFYPAMRLSLIRILCSPGFLFIAEPEGDKSVRRINDFELATRLAMFLWSSLPDDKLFYLATEGKLSNPQVLRQQIKRMLNDAKAERFVRNFAGQWLDVRDYGSVQPAREYRDYGEDLEAASIEEPYQFFGTILRENLPIYNFLDSEFLVINERLAKHYEIDGVEGEAFRKVDLRPQDNRGGVLGMAGLMTLLSDGTRTLPIRRATWVKEKLFDDPPGNPPPNAGEIQPNAQGENLTVRERLELHRTEPSCASCHVGLDPYGIALENYDAIGKWRTNANGENFRGGNTPVLDVSGELPNGKSFVNLEDYKMVLLEMKDDFNRAFAKQMLTYALGRPVNYMDNKVLDQITAEVRQNNYEMHSLITAIVMSEPFQTK